VLAVSRPETIRVTTRKRVTIERLFLTHAWHRLGIVEADGYVREDGYATNSGLDEGVRWFSGKLGSSIFRDRSEAVAAVKKKAAAKIRELQRRIAHLEKVAADGPDDSVASHDGTVSR
jgi:hypothetical protein